MNLSVCVMFWVGYKSYKDAKSLGRKRQESIFSLVQVHSDELRSN